ncbi:MAG: response regulator [Cytophagales bacterium]|nr:response regulator [Cytophagales bacterium]
MPIKTIIVDDEVEAREGIRLLLEEDPDIEILGLCKNGIEAIDMINDHEVDLVFLDIQMPVVSGFEVVRSIPGARLPYIIFITAYDQYAIKAFEVHATDYILKPFTDDRFRKGLTRTKQLIIQQKTLQRQEKSIFIADQFAQRDNPNDKRLISNESGKDESRLIVKERGLVKFIPIAEVIWIEAFDYYVKIHLWNQFHLIRESMKKLESKLPANQFTRIHKSSIINKLFIKEIRTAASSDLLITLTNGKKLKVGRTYREMIKVLLKDE